MPDDKSFCEAHERLEESRDVVVNSLSTLNGKYEAIKGSVDALFKNAREDKDLFNDHRVHIGKKLSKIETMLDERLPAKDEGFGKLIRAKAKFYGALTLLVGGLTTASYFLIGYLKTK